jgi:hypothetical protein
MTLIRGDSLPASAPPLAVMIIPPQLRALALDEPGAGITHAGISEGPSGNRRSHLDGI